MIKPNTKMFGDSPVKPALPTPEQWMEEDSKTQRDLIQKQFEQEWEGVNRQAKLGRWPQQRYQAELDKVLVSGKQRMAAFDQKTQANLRQFQRVDQLAQSGAFANPNEVKWKMLLGPEAESAMFPKPEKEVDPFREYQKWDLYRNRLERQLGTEGRDWYMKGPRAATGIRALLGGAQAEGGGPELMIYDPDRQEYRKGNQQELATLREIRRVDRTLEGLRLPTTAPGSLMGTAGLSPRMNPPVEVSPPARRGGSLSEQTKNLLQQRQTPQQRPVLEGDDPLGLR